MIAKLLQELKNETRFVLAIDGRCGAGKTTLAGKLKEALGCEVIHLDDFFLPWGSEKSGHGNLEKDRLFKEVLIPLSQNQEVNYRKFSCSMQDYTECVHIEKGRSVIIEGSYALLCDFAFAYTHKLFLDIDPDLQEKRIRERNGDDKWQMFATRWIPDEEAYIAQCHGDGFGNIFYYKQK